MTAVPPAAPLGHRRGAELGLLAFAVVIAMAAYTSVDLAIHESVPASVLTYGAGLAGLALAAHLAVRRLAPYADPLLLPLATLLNGLGVVLIRRLDLAGEERARQLGRTLPSADAPLQMAWAAVGVVMCIGVLAVLRDHRVLARYTYTAMAGGLALLALPAVLPPSLSEVNGARIWIRVGGFSIQPGEFAKIALVVFFAGYLVVKRDVLALASRRVLGVDLPRGRDMGPLLVAWLVSVGVLVVERDLGTSLLFFGIFLAVLYVATERRSWLLIGLGLFVSGALLATVLFAHVGDRVDSWLHPFESQQGQSYQLVQGMFGMATGGLVGTGLGQGRPDTVPFAKTDFIVATIGEELGLVGLTAVLVVFLLLVSRALRAAVAVRDSFGKLLAVGLAAALALQVFVVVGGVTRLIPLTGLTLPFVSYGGSSLVSSWMMVGLLLRVSDAARRPLPAAVAPDDALTQVVRR